MSLTVEKCLQAWTNSLRQLNVKADIVFFGDSLTYYADFSALFPDKVVCNLGLRGDTILGMINRMEQIAILEPRVIYLMAGINDVANCSKAEFSQLYDSLIRKILDFIPGVTLIVQSILPVNNKDFVVSCNNKLIGSYNNEIFNLANKYNLHYLDLFSEYGTHGILDSSNTTDGIHLKADSYNKWFKVILTSRSY